MGIQIGMSGYQNIPPALHTHSTIEWPLITSEACADSIFSNISSAWFGLFGSWILLRWECAQLKYEQTSVVEFSNTKKQQNFLKHRIQADQIRGRGFRGGRGCKGSCHRRWKIRTAWEKIFNSICGTIFWSAKNWWPNESSILKIEEVWKVFWNIFSNQATQFNESWRRRFLNEMEDDWNA